VRRLLSRFVWAGVCLVVWPIYYLALAIRWVIPWPLWPLSRVFAADDRLYRDFVSPPYLDRLRG
jgi:hypothetical protein